MATTGFWPVKSSLKTVIQYADNPDKTTARKYLDRDLADALIYVENDAKTDEKLFVSAINCDPETAYADMTATKDRFGKHGGNVAYHGFQSFRPGEVTPEECHRIGIRTARQMWGDQYEIVVTTHLNTDSLHNHFVVNSVSFKTGRKYENHIRDHIRLREISDRICRERALSVLEGARFYGGEKGAYWARKTGKPTHRDILKADIEYCIQYADSMEIFERQLRGLGYTIDWERFSVKALDWGRAIRLDRIGYSRDVIRARLQEHRQDLYYFQIINAHLPYRPKGFPLLSLEKQLDFDIRHCKSGGVVVLDVLFFAVLQMLGLAQNPEAEKQKVRPLSPSVRMELAKLDQIQKEYLLLHDHDIHTDVELKAYMDGIREEIALLEHDRQGVRNLLRRPKSPEETAALKTKQSEYTKRLKPLREELRACESILDRSEKLYDILLAEQEAEKQALQRERNRERTR